MRARWYVLLRDEDADYPRLWSRLRSHPSPPWISGLRNPETEYRSPGFLPEQPRSSTRIHEDHRPQRAARESLLTKPQTHPHPSHPRTPEPCASALCFRAPEPPRRVLWSKRRTVLRLRVRLETRTSSKPIAGVRPQSHWRRDREVTWQTWARRSPCPPRHCQLPVPLAATIILLAWPPESLVETVIRGLDAGCPGWSKESQIDGFR